MKINRKETIAKLTRSPKLTANVLWNIIDYFIAPREWWRLLDEHGADRARAAVVEHAIQEIGLAGVLRTVADCYRLGIA